MRGTLLRLCLLLAAFAPAALAQSAGAQQAFDAEEVTIKTDGYALAGTLLLPKGAGRRVPAVVTVTGPGPQTRDGAIPLPGLENYKLFRQLAEELAGRGIAVLRVDDRGYGSSTGRETLATATTSGLAADTRAQVAYLRGRREAGTSPAPTGILPVSSFVFRSQTLRAGRGRRRGPLRGC